MGFLDELLGNDSQRQDHQDFVDRYDQGAPHENISDQEASDRYQQVAEQLPAEQYQQSAQEAYSNMSPDERVQIGQHLESQAKTQGYDWPASGSEQYADPAAMATMTTQLHQQHPGLLGQLLGGGGIGGLVGGGGNGLGGLLGDGGGAGKGLLAGIAASALRKAL